MSRAAHRQPLRAARRRAGADESKARTTTTRASGRRRGGRRTSDDLVGYVHSYEVGSTVDGPGLRFVAFLTGCLLRCQYCHNPDTWHKHNGHPVTVSRAMKEIGKYAKVLKISKGGITISGGEPMRAAALRDADLPPLQGARACTPAWTPSGAWATG